MAEVETFKRIIQITPAYDKRNSDPHKNYGIHGCDMRMVLKGDKGAVQFLLSTNWYLPHVTKEMLNDCRTPMDILLRFCPMPTDLGYHSPIPQYEGHTKTRDCCEYLDGIPCYYDGSTLNAEPVFDILLKEGSEGVWKHLEEYYQSIFKK